MKGGTAKLSPQAEQAREDIRCRLDEVCVELGDEEILVVLLLARRLLLGQQSYGRLRLLDDARNLEGEQADEIADMLVYGGMAQLKRLLSREQRR